MNITLPDNFPYTPGDIIYFESPNIGAKFTWQSPSNLAPGMSKYDVLYVANIITQADSFESDLEGTFIVDGLMFPPGYKAYPGGNDPLNETQFTETITVNDVKLNDTVIFKGERTSLTFQLTEESYTGFDFWREQANAENEDLGLLLLKGEPYILKRLPV